MNYLMSLKYAMHTCFTICPGVSMVTGTLIPIGKILTRSMFTRRGETIIYIFNKTSQSNHKCANTVVQCTVNKASMIYSTLCNLLYIIYIQWILSK